MSGVVAATAASFALYYYLRQKPFASCGVEPSGVENAPPIQLEAIRNVERPPNTWLEALYYFKEVFRYMYTETLGRWHTVDLFVGLAYLSHRQTAEYAAADIAAKGQPISVEADLTQSKQLLDELQQLRRFMLYCRGLKFKKAEVQARYWMDNTNIRPDQILSQQATAGLLRPAYVLIKDEELKMIVLCIRGTQSMKDLFTSLTGAAKPHHVVTEDGVVLGYSHLGMLAGARWLLRQVVPLLKEALAAAGPDYQLRVVGHSMGGGTAVMLTMLLRDIAPEFADARCVAIACPACMTLELAASVAPFVTSVLNGTDIVPTFCSASVDALREDVTASSWFLEFQRDLRSSVMRALQGTMTGVGNATQWTTRNILRPAVTVPFRACYGRTSVSVSGDGRAEGGLVTVEGVGMCAEYRGVPRHQREKSDSVMTTPPGRVSGGGGSSDSGAEHSTSGAASGAPGIVTQQQQNGGSDGIKGRPAGPTPLPDTPLDEEVMAETLRSCLYAVEAGAGQKGAGGASLEGGGVDEQVQQAFQLMQQAGLGLPPASSLPPHQHQSNQKQGGRRGFWPWGGGGASAGQADSSRDASLQQQQPPHQQSPQGRGENPIMVAQRVAVTAGSWLWGNMVNALGGGNTGGQGGQQGAQRSRGTSGVARRGSTHSNGSLGTPLIMADMLMADNGAGASLFMVADARQQQRSSQGPPSSPFSSTGAAQQQGAGVAAEERVTGEGLRARRRQDSSPGKRQQQQQDEEGIAVASTFIGAGHVDGTGLQGGGWAAGGAGVMQVDGEGRGDMNMQDGEEEVEEEEEDFDTDTDLAGGELFTQHPRATPRAGGSGHLADLTHQGSTGSSASDGAAAANAVGRQLQAGITAVVAAVTGDGGGGGGRGGVVDEQAREAERVLREAESSPERQPRPAATPLPVASSGRTLIIPGRQASKAGGAASVLQGRSNQVGSASTTVDGGVLTPPSQEPQQVVRPQVATTNQPAVVDDSSQQLVVPSALVPPPSPTDVPMSGGIDSEEVTPTRTPGEDSLPRRVDSLRAGSSSMSRHVRHRLYPAGRILHFLPRSAFEQQGLQMPTPQPATQSQQQQQQQQQSSGEVVPGGSTTPVGALASGVVAAAAVNSTAPGASSDASAEAGQSQQGVTTSSVPPAAGGGAAAPESPAAAALAAAAAAAGVQVPLEPWILAEVHDHTAYGRVRLCRTMVMDHFVSSHLLSLESVEDQLRCKLGIPRPPSPPPPVEPLSSSLSAEQQQRGGGAQPRQRFGSKGRVELEASELMEIEGL